MRTLKTMRTKISNRKHSMRMALKTMRTKFRSRKYSMRMALKKQKMLQMSVIQKMSMIQETLLIRAMPKQVLTQMCLKAVMT